MKRRALQFCNSARMPLVFGTISGLVFALTTFFCIGAAAQSTADDAIFRIGRFDRSSSEFSSGEPAGPVNFMNGKSDIAKDWFAAQPAAETSGGKAVDGRSAPRSITFDLEKPAAPFYRLHIALLVENAGVPALKIAINGKTGRFYLHPHLDYSNGDQGDSFFPAFSNADVDFAFPGNFLRARTNTISLQVIQQSGQAVQDAGLVYDAIELESERTNDAGPEIHVEPTIFYSQHNGGLMEAVNAFLRHTRPLKPGARAALSLAGKSYTADVPAGADFGEEKVEFDVPEFAPHTPARVTAELDGRRQTFATTIDPAKKWTLYLVPHTHVDIGYSDYQPKVASIQARTIDEALDMLDKHPDFRFSLDGEWDLEQFLSTHSASQKERAIEAIRKQKMFVPAQYVNLLTGLPTAETLIRSLYPSANFSRQHGTPFDYANITDVPSYSWSYASILGAAGIHVLAGGSNNYRAPVLLQGKLNEKSPMQWIGPDGAKVLLWYSRIYQQMQMVFGLPPSIEAGRETLPLFMQMYSGPDYRADAAMLYGTQVENTDLFPQQAELAALWNAAYAYPRLRYSGFREALETIAGKFGDHLPTIRGDGAPYWEDGAGSDAHYVTIERRAEARAQTAEKLTTIAAVVNPVLKADPEELARMWHDMVLMDEHTWDSYNSVSDPGSREAVDQLAVKDQFAVTAAAHADFLTRRAMANIANVIPAGVGSVVVFNSLNWARSGAVLVDVDKNQEIIDSATNQPVPFEILSTGANYKHVRFIARDVPATGYKVYSLRKENKPATEAQEQQGATLENSYYKVELDPATGSIRSIYDKQLRREIVNAESAYRFGEYLYVTGGDKTPNTLLQYSHVYPKAELTVHPAQNGKLVSIVQSPDGPVARLESESVNTPAIRTEIRLDDHQKKIEIAIEIEKTEVYSKEAAYFAFPFAIKDAQFRYEEQNGVVDPARDLYPGAGHEWFTTQHWVSAEGDGFSSAVFPLDAPLVTLGDINRGEWPEQFGHRPGTIFSYIMNNYWDTNYRAGQGGHFSFRYVITSGDTTKPADLSRMGWNEATPLEADTVTSQDKAVVNTSDSTGKAGCTLDAHAHSFAAIDDPTVLLETWKPAEDGNGTVLRFLDLGGEERKVAVGMPCMNLDHVWQTDAVERGRTPISVGGGRFSFTIHPHEIVTLRVTGNGR